MESPVNSTLRLYFQLMNAHKLKLLIPHLSVWVANFKELFRR